MNRLSSNIGRLGQSPFRAGGTRFDRYRQARKSWACKDPACHTVHDEKPVRCRACGGENFWCLDSAIEAERFAMLSIRQAQGDIDQLEAQRTFRLELNGRKITTWRCDFIYVDRATGKTIVEDVKAKGAPLDPVSALKHAIFDAMHAPFGLSVTVIRR